MYIPPFHTPINMSPYRDKPHKKYAELFKCDGGVKCFLKPQGFHLTVRCEPTTFIPCEGLLSLLGAAAKRLQEALDIPQLVSGFARPRPSVVQPTSKHKALVLCVGVCNNNTPAYSLTNQTNLDANSVEARQGKPNVGVCSIELSCTRLYQMDHLVVRRTGDLYEPGVERCAGSQYPPRWLRAGSSTIN